VIKLSDKRLSTTALPGFKNNLFEFFDRNAMLSDVLDAAVRFVLQIPIDNLDVHGRLASVKRLSPGLIYNTPQR
jgi:hypothetical protein